MADTMLVLTVKRSFSVGDGESLEDLGVGEPRVEESPAAGLGLVDSVEQRIW